MIYILWLLVLVLSPVRGQAEMERGELKALLARLQSEQTWGEAVLTGGRVRQIRVDSLGRDSVFVREVSGPLFERAAGYALREFDSLRELGAHRIPLRNAPRREERSLWKALALETVLPGGGYFYIGEKETGAALIGLAAAAVGTGIATGKDGAAGWVPISAWVKIASLFNLRDEVRALNRSGKIGGARRGGGASPNPGHYLRSLEIGRMRGKQGGVPAVRIRTGF